MADKLSIIQNACTLTGNNVPNVADDGSPEWNAGSVAFDTAIDSTIQAHNWNFATAITTLQRAGDSPDEVYTDAYARPSDMLAIVWIRINYGPTDWKIINNQICLRSGGVLPEVKYVRTPDPGTWPPMFADVMLARVMAGLYRWAEDIAAANDMDARGDVLLAQARTRSDQDQPKRALFNSRLRESRRQRRPWTPSPYPWGGTGNPN